MSADELEVLRHVVHFLPLQIGDDDEDLVAADIVHPAQNHQLWELCARVLAKRRASPHIAAHHSKDHWHHRELALLHGAVVINVRSPRPIEGDQAPRIDRATEDVLGHEVPLCPQKRLPARARGVLALPDVEEPLVVGVVRAAAVLEPFVDQHIGRIVVQRRLHELGHGQAGDGKGGVSARALRHRDYRGGGR